MSKIMKKIIFVGLLFGILVSPVSAQEVNLTLEARQLLISELQAKIAELMQQLITELTKQLNTQTQQITKVETKIDSLTSTTQEIASRQMEEKKVGTPSEPEPYFNIIVEPQRCSKNGDSILVKTPITIDTNQDWRELVIWRPATTTASGVRWTEGGGHYRRGNEIIVHRQFEPDHLDWGDYEHIFRFYNSVHPYQSATFYSPLNYFHTETRTITISPCNL